jgi:hypothetical protein
MDRKFNLVRDYIYDNPGATIEAVCEETDVEKADVHRWLADGRLLLAQGSPIQIHCEKCGAPITTGKKCEQCLSKLRGDLSAAADRMRPPEPKNPFQTREEGRMHIGSRKK